ncbi:MAG TPA: fibronectin type III domain-containing protein [Candidatus Kapabacteria bacterium]|nr:fibronectin type III domain-containing protein [Candidatus Kapabacteria bacterium]
MNHFFREFIVHPRFRTHRIAVVAHLLVGVILLPFVIRELYRPQGNAVGATFTTTTIATIDSQLNNGAKTTNYGSNTTMTVQEWAGTNQIRMVVKFDLSFIPASSTITAATLKLYQSSFAGTPNSQHVHRLTRDWTESGVTWNRYDGTNSWTTVGGDYSSTVTATGTHSWVGSGTENTYDVTTDVGMFSAGTATNYGWLIKMRTENGSQNSLIYHTTEAANSAYHPRLTVTYTEPTGGPTVTANSATQTTDKTGVVDISVTVSDSGSANTKLKVLYATRTGSTCGDESFTTKATLDETAANVSASVTPKPTIENDDAYQIGTGTPIKTTSANTVQFDWLSETDVPNALGYYCLAFIGHNGTADSATTTVSVTLDNVSAAWNDSWNTANVDLGTVDASYRGEASGDKAGEYVAGAGDVNNDGYDDFLVAAPDNDDSASDAGQVYLFFGTSTGWTMDRSLSTAGASFRGEASVSFTQMDMAGVGDVNNDGYDDFLISVEGHSSIRGKVYLILGKASGWAMDTGLASADASYTGEVAVDRAGSAIGAAGDVNGDNYDDFIIGAYGNDEGGDSAGQVYLILGKASGWTTNVSLSNADASYVGNVVDGGLGGSISGVGDVNNDGYDDFVMGARLISSPTITWGGKVYVIFGKASGWAMDTSVSAANASYIGEASLAFAGSAVAPTGDVNNDGYDDFLIGAEGGSEVYSDAGEVYLILGKSSGWAASTSLSTADASWRGEAAGDELGDVRSIGRAVFDGDTFHSDFNGDGYDDIFIGSPYNDDRTTVSSSGQAYVFFGTSTGWGTNRNVGTASSSFWGEGDSNFAGYSLASAGDINNDGADDLIIGAYGNDDAATDAGQAYIVLSPGSSNIAPAVTVNSATQKSDGSGTVDISVAVGDANAQNTKMKVYYAARTGETCGDETFSSKATLDETAANVSATVTPKPDIENDNTYQVGTATPIKTSATNTLEFDWSARTNLPTGDGAYCLAFTANDSIGDGTTVYQSVTIDNVAPTAPGTLTVNTTSTQSVTFTLGSQTTETNFREYKVHYTTGSSGVTTANTAITSSTVSGLGSKTYGGLTTVQITGLATGTQYVANIFAYDSYGNTASSSAERTFYTLADTPGTPTVTASSTVTSSVTLVLNQATNPSSVTYAICQTSDGTTCAAGGYVQANGSLGASAIWQTYSTWGGANGVFITGLSSNTSYRFLVKARNGDSVETAFSSASTAVYTLANPVTAVTVSNASTSSTLRIQLSWTTANQTGMKIERDNSCDGSYDVTLFDSSSASDTTPTTTATNISANTCYQFRISSYNAAGTLNTAHRAESAQITSPPDQVQNVTMSTADTSNITWTWSSVTGTTQYDVYNASTNALLSSVSAPTTQYTQSGLSANTQYRILVRATNGNGSGMTSSEASAYTDASAPTGLAHTDQTTSSIRWTWTDGGQTAWYARDKNSVLNNSGWVTSTSWVYSGLSANTAYTVEVKARNASGEETAYTEITRYTSQNTPTSVSFSSVGATSLTVTANGTFPNQGTASSRINFNNGAGTTQDVTSGASWSNSALSPNTQYTYTVYATNGDGDQTDTASAAKYTLANAPGTITATALSTSSLSLALDRNSNPATTDVLIYETTSGRYLDTAAFTLTGDSSDLTTFTSWATPTVSGLAPNTPYQFIAVARNGESVLSASSTTSTAVYTLANAPGVPTVSAVYPTYLTLTIDTNSNTPSTEYAIYDSVTNQYVNASYVLATTTPIWQTTSTWGATTVTGLSPNTRYSFEIVARNGSAVPSATTTVTGTLYTAANVPTSVTLSADSQTQITVTWGANDNPAGTEYSVENVTGRTDSGWITTRSHAFTGLNCGVSYSFRVKARNASNVETVDTDGVSIQTAACTVSRSGGSGLPASVIAAPRIPVGAEDFSVSINTNAAYTTSQIVTLTFNGGPDAKRMIVSEHADFAGAGQEPYLPSKSFTLSEGDGVKTVYARFYTTHGVPSKVVSDSIVLTSAALIAPPVITSPASGTVFATLPFDVTGQALASSTVSVQVAGTEYVVRADADGKFTVTVLDQLISGTYKVVVSQKDTLGRQSDLIERTIIVRLPGAEQEEVDETPKGIPTTSTPTRIRQGQTSEQPRRPVTDRPIERVTTTTPSSSVAQPVLPGPIQPAQQSPTIEQVEEKVTEVAKSRSAFLLVLREESALFNKQQVNGIEAVQGERINVVLRPKNKVKSITARLYPVQTAGKTAKVKKTWKQTFFGQTVHAAENTASSSPAWVAGYVFSVDHDMNAFSQDFDVPADLPPGEYKLVITLNGEDGSREQMSKILRTLPQGTVSSTTGLPLSDARITIYSQDVSGEYVVWQGIPFGEQNPVRSQKDGKYAVHVPSGQYYVVVNAPLHGVYQSGIYIMSEPGIINDQFTLTSKGPDFWYRFISWIVGLFNT